MRRVSWVIGLLFAFGASAASPGSEAGAIGPSPEEWARFLAADARYKEAVDSKPLFVRVPTGAREVRFQVQVGGRSYLDEVVTLEEHAAREGAAVELLARDPQRLERLYALSANRVLPVSVNTSVDGKAGRRFDFAELVAHNRAIKLEGLRPVVGESSVTLHASEPAPSANTGRASVSQPDGPCQDQCWWEYQSCLDNCQTCPGCPLPLASQRLPMPECSYCYNDYNWCLSTCGPSCTPGQVLSQTTYSESQLVAIYGYNWECLSPWWNPSVGDWYQWTEWVYKTTTYRRTEYCQAPTTTEVIGISYSSFYCQYPLNIGCGFPWGSAWWACF